MDLVTPPCRRCFAGFPRYCFDCLRAVPHCCRIAAADRKAEQEAAHTAKVKAEREAILEDARKRELEAALAAKVMQEAALATAAKIKEE